MEDRDRQENLDEFDLDLFGDEEPDAGEEAGEEDEYVPKARVEQIIKKRLARERAKFEALANQFREIYNMAPEEVLEVGRKARAGQLPTPPEAPPNESARPVVQPIQDIPVAQPVMDPVARQKLDELERWRVERELQAQIEHEAQEFVALFPDVKFEDIPREVLERRARGGVTLAEAYILYNRDKLFREAAKKGAESAIADVERKRRVRTEGMDASGGTEDAVSSLTEEEREFARLYGMTPKEYIRYRQLADKYRKEE